MAQMEREMVRLITKHCPSCGQRTEITVPKEEYDRWRRGALVQNALPSLSRGERELLMTGYHPGCWLTAMRGL